MDSENLLPKNKEGNYIWEEPRYKEIKSRYIGKLVTKEVREQYLLEMNNYIYEYFDKLIDEYLESFNTKESK